jgi:(p)ppGpp synthase/HD superfamily hydrolase
MTEQIVNELEEKLRWNTWLRQAIELSVQSHANSTDRNDDLYILHPLWVMSNVKTTKEKIVAALHDCIEDVPAITMEYLRSRYDFPDEIINALDAITRKDHEPYSVYILRLGKNELARKVKLVDLQHNMSPERSQKMRPNHQKRYENALFHLNTLETGDDGMPRL